jgi:hypothetical protein
MISKLRLIIPLCLLLWHHQHQFSALKPVSNDTQEESPVSEHESEYAPSWELHWSDVSEVEKMFWWTVLMFIAGSIMVLSCLICSHVRQVWIRAIEAQLDSEPRIMLQQLVGTMQDLDARMVALIQQLERRRARLQDRWNHRLLLYCIICSQDRLLRLQNVVNAAPSANGN